MAEIANQNGSQADQLLDRAEKLKKDRGNWESHWQEIAERVLPDFSNTFSEGNLFHTTGGQKKTEKMIDSTAAGALQRFASANESMLTPRGSKWHVVRPSDEYLMKDREVRLYFDEVTNILFRYRNMPYANFAGQNNQNFMGLGAFGTGVMYIDKMQTPGYGKGLRYRSIHLAEIYFAENHQGLIDEAARFFKMTARQMAQRFGVDELPNDVSKVLATNPHQEFDVVHVVCPRYDYDPIRLDSKGKRFASYYISKQGKKIVEESGYDTFPYAIGRYTTAPGEIYGRSPAMLALPAIKVLNEEKATVLKQGHRAVDPVLLAHDDGILDTFSLRPGALNAGGVTAEGRPLVHALPTGNIAVGKDLMDDERAAINDIFLVTLFQILVDTPQMTATEVIERAREKGALLSPTMGRIESEYLASMIDRELDVLAQQRLLPPMPPALLEAAGEYEVVYDNPLSRMRRAEETAGSLRWVQQLTEIAGVTQDPSSLDYVNFDEMVPAMADALAVPEKFKATAEQVAAKRQGREQQMAAQQITNALPGVAAVMKANPANQ